MFQVPADGAVAERLESHLSRTIISARENLSGHHATNSLPCLRARILASVDVINKCFIIRRCSVQPVCHKMCGHFVTNNMYATARTVAIVQQTQTRTPTNKRWRTLYTRRTGALAPRPTGIIQLKCGNYGDEIESNARVGQRHCTGCVAGSLVV